MTTRVWFAAVVAAGCGFHNNTTTSDGAGPPLADANADADPAASESVELKIDLADPPAALAALGLADHDADTTQSIWFYDTAQLALYDAGAILRARKVHAGSDDSTVKARPMTVAQMTTAWLAQPGAKCEIDRTMAGGVSACSLTEDVAHGAIDAVGTGGAIASLYTSDQLVFLGSIAGTVDLTTLLRAGPIPSTVWSLAPADLATPLSIERWVLPDGTTLLEVSTRVPHDAAPAAQQALLAWLAARSLALSPDQSDKTPVALAAFF